MFHQLNRKVVSLVMVMMMLLSLGANAAYAQESGPDYSSPAVMELPIPAVGLLTNGASSVNLAASVYAQQAPKITSIGGASDGSGVSNGRWTGQLLRAPSGASNKYKGRLVCDTWYPSNSNPYYWDINGQNFGTAQGTVLIGPNPSPIGLKVLYWSNTRIRVLPTASYMYTSSAVTIIVRTAQGLVTPPWNDSVVALIKSRGYGQCTWFVAYTRLSAGLSIPPSAYFTTGSIPAIGGNDNGYQPARWDGLVYPQGHVAIITSVPQKTNNSDGSITWTFTVGEMNAKWDEVQSSSTRTYKLSKFRKVITGIGTNANSAWVATAYYR
jgi:hypothetical protein